jgi:hypothetical protein
MQLSSYRRLAMAENIDQYTSSARARTHARHRPVLNLGALACKCPVLERAVSVTLRARARDKAVIHRSDSRRRL